MAGFDRWYEALACGAGPAYQQVLAEARGADELLGQQGFSTARDILALGRAVGAGAGRALLDVCCGAGEPAALLAARLGASVVGLDYSTAALQMAAARPGPPVHYVAADALHQPFPAASFHSALMLDSLIGIRDKARLLGELARVLVPGGRFGCTVESGEPLGPADLGSMEPGAEAHVLPAATFLGLLREASFRVLQIDDRTSTQAGVARRLAQALVRHRVALVAELGATVVDDLTATVTTFAELLGRRRLAMLAVVAERLA